VFKNFDCENAEENTIPLTEYMAFLGGLVCKQLIWSESTS